MIYNMFDFGSQFFVYECDYPNKKKLINHIQQKHTSQITHKPSSWDEDVHTSIIYDAYTSPKDYFIKAEIPEDLVNLLDNIVQDFVTDQNLQSLGVFYITEMWYNAYSYGQYQHMHKHSNGNNNMFSGVYYLKFEPTKHTSTRFYNPSFEIDFDKVKNNKYFVLQPKIKENQVIIFPSDIGHDVPKQTTDELRITISFNVQCSYHEHMQYT